MARVLVYGATGFTAGLVLERLRELGIEFIVAGRTAARVADVAARFEAPSRVFSLTDIQEVERGLRGVEVLLNAAGPFRSTTPQLARACLSVGVHYLDVSGEVSPLALLARLDDAARIRGVMLLPAVGFDVVPSDCLAMHLAQRMPDAEELSLSIQGSDLLSRGSARTFAEHAGVPVYVRNDGVLEPMRFRTQVRWTDFGDGHRPTIATSWGDLVTAYHSTGIPNIDVYFEATVPRVLGVAGNQYLGWMFDSPWARASFRQLAEVVPEGPPAAERARHGARIVGEVRKGHRRLRAVVSTSEAYTFTALATGEVIRRVLGGEATQGFQTPSALFGPDFALGLGATRQDLA